MQKTQISLVFSFILFLALIGIIAATDAVTCYSNGGKIVYNEDGSYYCANISNSGNYVVLPEPSVIGSVSYSEPQKPPYTPSQAEIDCNKKGCFLLTDNYYSNGVCYPVGYVRNGTYCSETAESPAHYFGAFVNQSETGSSCIQGYECKTGVCSNNVCINLTEQNNKINAQQYNLTLLSQPNVEPNANSPQKQQSVNTSNSLIQKIVNFLKTFFGFS